MIQPPATGPAVGARTARTPAIVVAKPLRRTGKEQEDGGEHGGISIPPEKP